MDNQKRDKTLVSTQPAESIRIKGGHVINPVDEDKMRKLLDDNPCNGLGLVLRLAWRQGLTRDEICKLVWDDVDFVNKTMAVDGREIPLDEKTEECMLVRRSEDAQGTAPVVVSDKYKRAFNPAAISNMARAALNQAGMKNVRLIDLRHDFVIRQIKEHGWTYAIRVSGLAVATFQVIYAGLDLHAREENEKTLPDDTEYRLWNVLQKQKDKPEGIALWLVWQLGLSLKEIVELTWDDIDFTTNEIHLSDRTEPMTQMVCDVLSKEKLRHSEEDDPHVILSPRSRGPMPMVRLSKIIRTVLIHNNIDKVSIYQLRGIGKEQREKQVILDLAQSKKGILRKDVMKELSVGQHEAARLLGELVEEKKLARVYCTYYLAGLVVPKEKQEELVLQYIRDNKIGYVEELSAYMGMRETQCKRLLGRMVKEGKLCNQSFVFSLPDGT